MKAYKVKLMFKSGGSGWLEVGNDSVFTKSVAKKHAERHLRLYGVSSEIVPVYMEN